jgi:UDP-N-acetylmuramoyl-tripeptide--D-alanyl-D-alanine ligase
MMPSLHLDAIAALIGGTADGAAHAVRALAIDSRRVQPGDLFVALRGARTDGHRFLGDAAAAGAVAALVEDEVRAPLPTLRVDDALAAMNTIAIANRNAYAGELVAMTGSCGKTSVKNLCHAIFNSVAPTVATAGNYNNEIGVPLTLARIGRDTRFAVVEMGATGRGDIAHLCELARPRVAVVLNAMEAHLEGFGSVADVADIKAEIYDRLGAAGVGIINADQPWAPLWRKRVAAAGARCLEFSLASPGTVTARALDERGLAGTAFTLVVDGRERELLLPLPGRHNVANALAAAAIAHACDVDIDAIVAGLSAAQAEPGRLQAETLGDGTVLIDDSYNANPGSVRAAIELLAATRGRRCLLLGDMLELGADSERYHREMGALARERGIDLLWGVGAAAGAAVGAFGGAARAFVSREAVVEALPGLLTECDLVLVKGSRGAAMDSLLDELRRVGGGD